MDFLLAFVFLIPLSLVCWKMMAMSALKYAEKAISDGYKGVRLPIYKYNHMITSIDGCGERGRQLSAELRLIRDNKIPVKKQLDEELKEIDYE